MKQLTSSFNKLPCPRSMDMHPSPFWFNFISYQSLLIKIMPLRGLKPGFLSSAFGKQLTSPCSMLLCPWKCIPHPFQLIPWLTGHFLRRISPVFVIKFGYPLSAFKKLLTSYSGETETDFALIFWFWDLVITPSGMGYAENELGVINCHRCLAAHICNSKKSCHIQPLFHIFSLFLLDLPD